MAYCLLLCNEITVITKYTKSAAVNASGWTMFFWEANLVLIFYCTNHYLVNRYICCFFSLILFVFSPGAHGNNLIAVLAKYIYHKHDPALPRLAIQLLKRLATVRQDTHQCSFASPLVTVPPLQFLQIISSGFFVSGSLVQVS